MELTEQEVKIILLLRELDFGQMIVNKEDKRIVNVKRTESIKV